MTENKREELKNVKELIECGMFTEEEIINDPKRTIKEKQMLGLLKDSKTNETIKTNEAEYTIEQLLDERGNIVDTALKDNHILQHILNHSDNIAEAYTVLNFDTVVKNEYQIDKESEKESRMYDSIADCFYSVSDINGQLAYEIIQAFIIAIINNDWCFIAEIFNGNMDYYTANSYSLNKARISLDRKAFWENENKTANEKDNT